MYNVTNVQTKALKVWIKSAGTCLEINYTM